MCLRDYEEENKNKLFGKVCIYSLHYTVLVFEAVLKQPDINKCH